MSGTTPENLAEYYWAQGGIVENGIIPAEFVNFEKVTQDTQLVTFKTFDMTIHNGLYIKMDITKIP